MGVSVGMGVGMGVGIGVCMGVGMGAGVHMGVGMGVGCVSVVCLTSSRGWLSSRGINRKTVHQPPTPATS